MAELSGAYLEYLDRLEKFKAVARTGFAHNPAAGALAGELNGLFVRLTPEEQQRAMSLPLGPTQQVVEPVEAPVLAALPNGNGHSNGFGPSPLRGLSFWGRVLRGWRAFQGKE